MGFVLGVVLLFLELLVGFGLFVRYIRTIPADKRLLEQRQYALFAWLLGCALCMLHPYFWVFMLGMIAAMLTGVVADRANILKVWSYDRTSVGFFLVLFPIGFSAGLLYCLAWLLTHDQGSPYAIVVLNAIALAVVHTSVGQRYWLAALRAR